MDYDYVVFVDGSGLLFYYGRDGDGVNDEEERHDDDQEDDP